MRFECNNESFEVLDRAARTLGMDGPGERRLFIDLADERLIEIAKILGMPQFDPPQIHVLEDFTLTRGEAMQMLDTDSDPMPEIITAGITPLCEICGQPTAGKRYKICSKEECRSERKKRYNREYQRNYKKKSAAEVAGNESGPLASLP